MGLFNRKKKTAERCEGKMFIFSSISSMEPIITAIGGHFGIESNNKGNTLNLNNGDIAIEVLVVANEMGEDASAFVKDQVERTWGHFYQVSSEHTDIKTNLLYKIKMTKGIVIIEYKFDHQDSVHKKQMIESMFTELLNPLYAVMLIAGEDAGIYRCGPDNNKQLILSDKGKSELLQYLPEQPFELVPGEYINQEQIDRRLRSREVLREKGIFVTGWYPVIECEEQTVCRTAGEIAGRAAALLIVALYSECLLGEDMSIAESRDFIEPIIERFEADNYFSPAEKNYLNNQTPTEAEMINYSWQYENLCVMEWALGLIDSLDFPDSICDVAGLVRNMKEFESIKDIIDHSKPRTKLELLDQCDLIFCLDWACVDTRIKQLPAPAGMEGGVVMERHKSLNWLCGYNESAPWDEVTTDT